MNTHQKFLSFNGKNIVFLNADGQYWIAIKPICEALGVNFDRQFKNIKDNPILAPAYAIQHIQVPSENGVIQSRKLGCLPEKYVYGWIFSINSDSPELWEYKKTCYDVLYNHFHGIITNRKELLLNKMELDTKIHTIKEELNEANDKFVELSQLQKRRKAIELNLKKIDKELVEQPKLF